MPSTSNLQQQDKVSEQAPSHRRSSKFARRFSRRFSSKRWFRENQKDPDVRGVLNELGDDELETAAKTIYKYVQNPSPDTRELYATSIGRRYLDSKNGNVALATKKLKKTLQFRQDYDIEGLMTAFEDRNSKTAQNLYNEVKDKKFYVQSYDKDGRATLYFVPRNTTRFDKEWHLKEAIYSIERAIACSKTLDGTINAIVDFSGFSIRKHSPPMDIGKEFLTTLRSHYAGQINKIFLLDCPASFNILWKIFSPFIGTNTRSKIEFLSGRKQKAKFTKWYSVEEVPPFVHPDGCKDRDLDVNEYLFELRFDEAFDQTPKDK